jgi:hypothetical protein
MDSVKPLEPSGSIAEALTSELTASNRNTIDPHTSIRDALQESEIYVYAGGLEIGVCLQGFCTYAML